MRQPREATVRQDERFARWLKRARKKAGIRQEDLAEWMGVTQVTISRWENEGLTIMEPDRVRNLALFVKAKEHEAAEAMGYPVASAAQETRESEDIHLVMNRLAELHEEEEELHAQLAAIARRAGGEPPHAHSGSSGS